MTTKYSCDDIVYIPCKIFKIKIDNYGVQYRAKVNSNVYIVDSDAVDIEESELAKMMERIYVNEEE